MFCVSVLRRCPPPGRPRLQGPDRQRRGEPRTAVPFVSSTLPTPPHPRHAQLCLGRRDRASRRCRRPSSPSRRRPLPNVHTPAPSAPTAQFCALSAQTPLPPSAERAQTCGMRPNGAGLRTLGRGVEGTGLCRPSHPNPVTAAALCRTFTNLRHQPRRRSSAHTRPRPRCRPRPNVHQPAASIPSAQVCALSAGGWRGLACACGSTGG